MYDCSGLGLTLIPHSLPDDTIAIDLSNNNIGSISGEDFPASDILLQISLGHNKITYIPRSSFLGLPNLRHLDVSYNRLTGFDNGTLNHLHFLRVLNLNHNSFSKTKTIMTEIGQLNMLELFDISVSGFFVFP
jgi:Leucine-rich repeat (LRR) protein